MIKCPSCKKELGKIVGKAVYLNNGSFITGTDFSLVVKCECGEVASVISEGGIIKYEQVKEEPAQPAEPTPAPAQPTEPTGGTPPEPGKPSEPESGKGGVEPQSPAEPEEPKEPKSFITGKPEELKD